MSVDKNITINFIPKGDKKLIDAFEGLAKSQRKFNKTTQRVTDSTNILGNRFSVVRSKLLLFNFAMGMGVRQLMAFGKQAAQVDLMGTAFNNLAGETGNATTALIQLKEATNGTMSELDLLIATLIALPLPLSER